MPLIGAGLGGNSAALRYAAFRAAALRLSCSLRFRSAAQVRPTVAGAAGGHRLIAGPLRPPFKPGLFGCFATPRRAASRLSLDGAQRLGKNGGMNPTVFLICEYLYFLAGIALTVIAAIGLKQLTISKEGAEMSATREAFRLAADQTTLYLHVIIPLAEALDKVIAEKNITFFRTASFEIEDDAVKFNHLDAKDHSRLSEITPQLLALYNALEGFSLYFISRVADEESAYSAVGKTFCHTVQKVMPDLYFHASESQYFQNVLRLFFLWNSRSNAQELESQKLAIEEQLQKVQGKFIRPLGTGEKG